MNKRLHILLISILFMIKAQSSPIQTDVINNFDKNDKLIHFRNKPQFNSMPDLEIYTVSQRSLIKLKQQYYQENHEANDEKRRSDIKKSIEVEEEILRDMERRLGLR